ncbi:MAG: succinyl-diaminopimelate desuccinylase [Rhizobiaceae bacterium]
MKTTDPVQNLQKLIRIASVTPQASGALDALGDMLGEVGMDVQRVTFKEEGTDDVDNLYGRLGTEGPHLMFAGHVDVVPPGEPGNWKHDPFSGAIEDGILYGRGAVDMKGGIAAFVAAIARYVEENGNPPGSVLFLITGDEEGPAVNGTSKLLKWAADRGETWDGAIVGEPTNPAKVGDAVKSGRRGSLSGRIIVTGVQGHSAYPHLADNPVHGLSDLLDCLLLPAFDEGSSEFEPSNIEVTSVDTGNPATNVIPESVSASFNIRFNDLWDGDSVKREIERRLNEGASLSRIRHRHEAPVKFEIEWIGRVSPVFLTRDHKLIGTLGEAIESVTGSKPTLSTGGGTSDARFIKDYCPVVDFGLVGKTMHKTDEQVPLEDLETLTSIYLEFLKKWFD